jgi:hypothetical protein
MMTWPARSPEDAMKRIAFVAVWGLGALLCASSAWAGPLSPTPKSTHSALTLTTDGTYGYQVFPGKPLSVDLVGPGSLVFTVRLNHAKKLPSFVGELEIKRAGKSIKKDKLNLFRSRVGAYKENKRLQPSNPKSFKIKVPDGLQSYSISLKAARGTSMTLNITYDSNADQTAAMAADDMALVPLVAPGAETGGESGGIDDIPLVPLAPADAVAVADKPKPVEPVKPADKPKPVEPVKPVVVAVAPADKPRPVEPIKPVVVAVAPADKPKPVEPKPGVETIDGQSPQPPEVSGQATEVPPVVSLGLKLGQISPFQSVGTTSFTGMLDLRWIIPATDGKLHLGVEVGYHQYGLKIAARDLEAELKVIPVALQLFYAIPLGGIFQLFVGAGGDMYVVMSESRYSSDPGSALSGTSFAFGGHVCAGAELELGPGFLGLEVRAGFTSADVTGMSNVNVAGLSTVLGYRLEF